MDKNSKLVYSTHSNEITCPRCGKLECECSKEKKSSPQGALKISLDRKGRKGKSMTLVEGFSVNPQHLADIAKELKQFLGTGGTAKQGRIEIQGDQRSRIKQKLEEMGYKTKLVGG